MAPYTDPEFAEEKTGAHWTRLHISAILAGIILFVPLNILVIGDWLGSGIQWALFRYQITYLGSNIIPANKDLIYVLDGYIGGSSALSIICWISGLIFLFLSLLICYYIPGKNGLRSTGILIIAGGFAFLISTMIQYGILFHGPAGFCIPVGIPLIFITGWWFYGKHTDVNKTSESTRADELFSSIKAAIITLIERNTAICIFIFTYLVYNSIYVTNTNGDTIAPTFFPVSMLVYHNLYFDQFGQLITSTHTDYGFLLINGHYYSLFPIVTPTLMLPVYAIAIFFCSIMGVPLDTPTIMLIAKSCAALITAFSVVVVYWVLNELLSKKTAILSTFIYAFATSTWSTSSQALWQHGMVELLLILMIWCMVRNERENSLTNIILLGFFSGLFMFNRPPDIMLIIPAFYYVLFFYRRYFGYYALAGIASGLPFLLYNTLIFGNVFGGYSNDFHQFIFNGDFVIRYLGLLISPNVGLFILTPILILSIFGYYKVKNFQNPHIARILLIFGPVILLTILPYSFFDSWFSQWCYGPRYLTAIVPVLIIYCAFFFEDFLKSPVNRLKGVITITLIILIAASVIVQFVGVYYYVFLPTKAMDDTRAWDWNHSIVIDSINAGLGKDITIVTYTFPPFPPLMKFHIKGTG